MSDQATAKLHRELRELAPKAEAARAELARPGRAEDTLDRIVKLCQIATLDHEAQASMLLGRIQEAVYRYREPLNILAVFEEKQRKLEQAISEAAPSPGTQTP